MSFRLWTIFYVFALLAAAMATFGPFGGIVAAILVLAFWAWKFYAAKPPTFIEFLVIVCILGIFVALLLPAVSVRESSRRGHCMNNLKQLALSLLMHDESHGTLPPAYTANENGTPLLSWRALILPRIERQDIYEQLDQTKAWQDPANTAATSIDIDVFHCPSDPGSVGPFTNYFAVVGPQTAWPEKRGRKMADITDPKSYTILLIDCISKSVPWAEPTDLAFDEAVELLSGSSSKPHHFAPRPGFFYKGYSEPRTGINVAMADGEVRFLTLPLPRELAIAVLTTDGGEGDLHKQLDLYSLPQLDYAKCYALAVFVLLSILPVARLLRRD